MGLCEGYQEENCKCLLHVVCIGAIVSIFNIRIQTQIQGAKLSFVVPNTNLRDMG